MKNIVIIIVAFLILALGGGLYMLNQGKEKTDDASIEANIVPIIPKVSGYVVALNVKDNQKVKAGDVLLQIDQSDYQHALDQAKANYESAVAKLEGAQFSYQSVSKTAPADVVSAQANVDKAKFELDNAQLKLRRAQSIGADILGQQRIDDAKTTVDAAMAVYKNTKSALNAAQTAPDKVNESAAGIKGLEANVNQAKAAMEQAEDNLKNTTLIAVEDGYITKRNIEQGSFVQAGQQLLSLVGADIWVVANFKENQIKSMKPGQKVDIEIDAFPGSAFEGKVDSIQKGTGARFSLFPPENATGNFVKVVQRVPVKITFVKQPDAQMAIGPGMSVIPTVYTK